MTDNNTTTPDRTLAQIVKVTNIRPIEGADKIELANVLGWEVVVKKDEFKVGDLGVYFTIGAVLDVNNPDTNFLQGKVLKTKKIRGVLSQGLLGPLVWLKNVGYDMENISENNDVTDILNVKKFVPLDELYEYFDDGYGVPFPSFVPKTSEKRVQQCPTALRELEGKDVVITQKFDGTSTTFVYCNNQFIICGRNRGMKPLSKVQNSEQTIDIDKTVNKISHYYEMEKLYDLENKMTAYGKNIAIQGEIIGPRINGNRHNMKSNDYYVFNIFDIDKQIYMSFDDVENVCNILGLKTVKVVYKGVMKPEWLDMKAILDIASSQRYDSGNIAEGVVVKTNYGAEMPRTSFKAISNEYLLKYNL